jgi:hypothetical protein
MNTGDEALQRCRNGLDGDRLHVSAITVFLYDILYCPKITEQPCGNIPT